MLRSGADRAPRVASRRCWPVSSWRPPAAAQRWRQQHPQSTLAGGLRAARSAKARVAASLAGAAAGAAGALVVAKVALPASPVSRAEAAAPGEPARGAGVRGGCAPVPGRVIAVVAGHDGVVIFSRFLHSLSSGARGAARRRAAHPQNPEAIVYAKWHAAWSCDEAYAIEFLCGPHDKLIFVRGIVPCTFA